MELTEGIGMNNHEESFTFGRRMGVMVNRAYIGWARFDFGKKQWLFVSGQRKPDSVHEWKRVWAHG